MELYTATKHPETNDLVFTIKKEGFTGIQFKFTDDFKIVDDDKLEFAYEILSPVDAETRPAVEEVITEIVTALIEKMVADLTVKADSITTTVTDGEPAEVDSVTVGSL